MIAVNLDKARAIARKLAERVTDEAARAQHLQAIATAATVEQLRAAVARLQAAPSVPTE